MLERRKRTKSTYTNCNWCKRPGEHFKPIALPWFSQKLAWQSALILDPRPYKLLSKLEVGHLLPLRGSCILMLFLGINLRQEVAHVRRLLTEVSSPFFSTKSTVPTLEIFILLAWLCKVCDFLASPIQSETNSREQTLEAKKVPLQAEQSYSHCTKTVLPWRSKIAFLDRKSVV